MLRKSFKKAIVREIGQIDKALSKQQLIVAEADANSRHMQEQRAVLVAALGFDPAVEAAQRAAEDAPQKAEEKAL